MAIALFRFLIHTGAGFLIIVSAAAMPGVAGASSAGPPCASPATRSPGTSNVGSDPLPGKVSRLFEQEQTRIEKRLGPEKSRRVIGTRKVIHRLDVDEDLEESIREDVYIARLDCRDATETIHLFVFWNDYLLLPGGRVKTGEWKVVTFPTRIWVTDVNEDGVDDYVGKLIVVPSVKTEPRTRFMRRAMISSPDEIGAFRPVRLIGEDAMPGSELPMLADTHR